MSTKGDEPSAERVVGVALSGGGIRSAAFCAGCLQSLQIDQGLLKGPERARYLAAVSGGSYAAAAYYLAAGGALDTPSVMQPGRQLLDTTTPDGHPLQDQVTRWRVLRRERVRAPRKESSLKLRELQARATEQSKRGWVVERSSSPLSPGSAESEHLRRHARYIVGAGYILTAARFAIGLVVHISLIVLMLFSVSFALGAGSSAIVAIADDEVGLSVLFGFFAVGYIVLIVGVSLISEALRRRQSAVQTTEGQLRLAELVATVTVASVLSLLGIGGRSLAESGAWGGRLEQLASDLATYISLASTSLVLIAPALAWLSKSPFLATPGNFQRFTQRVGRILLLVVYRLLQLVGALVVPAALLVLFGVGWTGGFNLTDENPEYLWFLFPMLTFLIGALYFFNQLGGLSTWSLYRSALASCFDLELGREDGRDLVRQRFRSPYLSALRELVDMPELLIMASANLTEPGVSPAGSYARPVVFSSRTVSIAGEPRAELDTKAFERVLETQWRTSFACRVIDCVAVGGAAISPTMGRFTRWWLRAIMFILNVRLGVWIPNPASSKVQQRLNSDPGTWRSRRLAAPPFRYFWREALGTHYLRADQIYVSDGGHYDNLGIVELVRRGCNEIWVCDASLDPPGSALALAQSLTLISSELGYEVNVPLDDMGPLLDGAVPLTKSTYVRGEIRSRGSQPQYSAVLHVVKLGLDPGTSDRLRVMRRKYRRFPYDSTTNQFYSAERFDLYRELGFENMSRAYRASQELLTDATLADGAEAAEALQQSGEQTRGFRGKLVDLVSRPDRG